MYPHSKYKSKILVLSLLVLILVLSLLVLIFVLSLMLLIFVLSLLVLILVFFGFVRFFSLGVHGSRQALVLTHEDASDIEKFPYLSVMLRPLQVVEFYGRCATRDPPCRKSEAVFHWWKDL